MSDLTRIDHWVLARCISGYDLVETRGQLSPKASQLVAILELLGVKDRELILRRNVSPDDWKNINSVDTEADEPADRTGVPSSVSPIARQDTYYFIRAAELKKLPPVTWLIQGELPEAGLTMLYGASGSAKSFLALDYALIVAQTHPVIYGAFEGEQGYPARVEAWVQHHRKPCDNLIMCMGYVEMMRDGELAKFIADVKREQPRLVVIDTVAMSMIGADENSSRDVGLYIKGCKSLIRETGCAVLLVHHTNKGGQMERGSGALRGACDMMIRLSLEDDVIVKMCSKSKDSKLFDTTFHKLREMEMHINGRLESSAVIVPSDRIVQSPGADLTTQQRRVLEMLALPAYKEEGCTFAQISEDTGISIGVISRICSRLLSMEFVKKEGQRPAYWRIIDAGLKKIEPDDSHDSHDSVDSPDSQSNGNHPVKSSESSESMNQTLPGFSPRKKSARDL